MTVILSLKQIV